MQYEEEILSVFRNQGLQVVSMTKGKKAYSDTLTAMQAGTDVIYQAALTLQPKGYADFLVKDKGGS